MKIKYNKQEMRKIINALDFYSRIWIGQYDHILWELRWTRDCDQLDKLDNELAARLMRMRNILQPELMAYGWSASHGIFSDEISYKAGVAYDMQQVFRYELATFLEPDEKKRSWCVDFNTPMKCDLDPYKFPKAKCFEKDGDVYEEINVEKEQYEIIQDALVIKEALLNGDITRIFSFYTDDDEVLKLANKVTELLATVERKR